MTDDERISGLIRRAGGSVDDSPDFDEIYRRSRRRRTTRIATSLAVALALAAVAGVTIDAIPTPRTIQFAQTAPRAAPSTEPGQTGAADPSQASPPATPTDASTVDGVPEGALVAVPDGFVIVSGNVPASVWFSRDGRDWVEQPAQDLYSDVANDAAATPDGMVVVLDVTSVLWTSGDLGRSWQRIDLPAAVSSETPTAVAANDTSWLLGGSRAGEAFLFVVPRDAPDEYEKADGDFTHQQDLMVPHIAARGTDAVMITNGRGPIVWRVADDRAVTRTEGVFGDAQVIGVAMSGMEFTASVLTETEGGEPLLELWTSSDGLRWSQSGAPIPAPTCAQVAVFDGTTLAAGRPCDADVGWQAWLRPADGEWNRID